MGQVRSPILISNALFGAAAAVLLTNRPGQGGVRGFSAGLYPQDCQYLCFRTENSKLRNVLGVEVPAVGAGEVIGRLLAEHRLSRDGIDHWLVHPGGLKVLDAFPAALGLPPTLWLPHGRRCTTMATRLWPRCSLCLRRPLATALSALGTPV